MFDLKVINAVLSQMEEERGIPKNKIIEAIEMALGTAYKKEYGKKGQIIKAKFDINSGDVEFWQSKIVVEKEGVIMPEEEFDLSSTKDGEEPKPRYNPEHHILIEEAKLIKKDSQVGDELNFPLDKKSDFGRIAAQTAKQVITQKIREAEKVSVVSEFGEKEGEIVSGTIERVERGTIFLDMGRAIGMLSYEEQIPGERFKQGERVRAYLFKVDETSRGVFLKLSRSHPKFLEELFRSEVPEMSSGTVEIKAIAREAGARSKVAVYSNDEHIDPVGSLVGQRGVRVSTIMSELGGEKIDIIEWSEKPEEFISEALSPAKILDIKINSEEKIAQVKVAPDQQSLAIGKGGQNVRLAAKLTGWKIDVISEQNQTNTDTPETQSTAQKDDSADVKTSENDKIS
ncbi:MAG TPA: transcription termination factor NusA [Candidatus Paceibacterota bacterium]|nr:transcription termination factor NusA [Candidatus Paceibacterota bacterium]HMP19049.1 transcription termination factor NusA [Candidatus Paceibacterota bacterium]HMP85438.1 transcription termination factor NusA [Candidatus Paceibacterota bacterium]